MMSQLLNYSVESGLCMAVFYLFYLLVLRQQPAFGYNRAYLIISSLLALVFPLLEIPIYATASQGISGVGNGLFLIILPELTLGDGQATEPAASWQLIVLTIYLTGVTFALVRFLRQLFLIRMVIRKSKKYTMQQGYVLIHTDGTVPTSSFFHYLLWNDRLNLNEQDKHHIIAHEEIHIRHRHSYDVMYMAVLKILFWFNPFVYLYFKALTDVHEFAADAAVIKYKDYQTYSKILVNQLFQQVEFPLLNHFYKSQTLKRLTMMKRNKNKFLPLRALLALPVFALMFFIFSCQKEEDTMIQSEASVKTYESLQTEIEQLNNEMQTITSQYPDYKLDWQSLNKVGYDNIGLTHYKEAITGVDNSGDKNKLARIHMEINKLNKEMVTHAMPDTEGIYTVVEDQPTPEGGMQEFYTYIMKNLKYPTQARRMGIEGKVFVQFVVDVDGSITEVKTLKGIGAGCDDEAERVLTGAKAWIPGMQKGLPVKVRMVLPITFALNNGDNSKAIGSADTGKKTMELKALPKESTLADIFVVGHTK